MSIVVLDIVFPNSVLVAGVTGTMSRQNDRSQNQGGYATVNAVRDVTLRAWQVGTAPLLLSSAEELMGVWEATDAGAYGLLLQDPIDASASTMNGALQGYMTGVESGVAGFGNGCPTYGLRKVYRFGAYGRARAVTRPNGTPTVTRGGSPVTIGVSAGNIAISAGPSYVTFVPDETRSVTGVTAGATTQVVLSSAIAGLVTSTGKLWLQGLGGADADLLNNKSHTITNIASGTYTLATNTAGKTITAGAGQGHKYPQPDEALAWTGNFYVPVNFRDDALNWDLAIAGPTSGRRVSIPSTYLDEIREA